MLNGLAPKVEIQIPYHSKNRLWIPGVNSRPEGWRNIIAYDCGNGLCIHRMLMRDGELSGQFWTITHLAGHIKLMIAVPHIGAKLAGYDIAFRSPLKAFDCARQLSTLADWTRPSAEMVFQSAKKSPRKFRAELVSIGQSHQAQFLKPAPKPIAIEVSV